jgi:hypothetical protein
MRSKSAGRSPFHRIAARGRTYLENPLKVETRVQIPLGLPRLPAQTAGDRPPENSMVMDMDMSPRGIVNPDEFLAACIGELYRYRL